MISRQDVEKLLGIRAHGPSVLSVYIAVPADPDARRGLPARAGELFALAGAQGPGAPAAQVPGPDRARVLALMDQHAREWLGHTVAIFVSTQAGLVQTFKIPCEVPERAVLATRPHVRPLLVALQRCPAYLVAVVDRQHAWVLGVTGEQIGTLAESQTPGVRSSGFGGWYGLDSFRVQERVIQLARHHFRETGGLLERMMHGDGQPLVVAGHEQTVPEFLARLPAAVRDHVIGSFVTDPHTLTPARARALSAPVVGDWVHLREDRLVLGYLQEPPSPLTALGLNACLDAVGQHAVASLLLPVGGVVPGYACPRCGALGATAGSCPEGHTGSRAVPDLLEEMAVAVLEEGGQVDAVREPPGEVAARLRFPVRPPGGGQAPAQQVSDTQRRN